MPLAPRKRRGWAYALRALCARGLAGALTAVVSPWVVVRELAGAIRAFRWPLSVTVCLVPAEWTFARERYAWHQTERLSVRWRLRAGLVVVARRETEPFARRLERHTRALNAQLLGPGSTSERSSPPVLPAKRRRP